MYEKITVKALAAQIGIHPQTVRDRARRRGINPEMKIIHGHVEWMLTPEQAKEIEEAMF